MVGEEVIGSWLPVTRVAPSASARAICIRTAALSGGSRFAVSFRRRRRSASCRFATRLLEVALRLLGIPTLEHGQQRASASIPSCACSRSRLHGRRSRASAERRESRSVVDLRSSSRSHRERPCSRVVDAGSAQLLDRWCVALSHATTSRRAPARRRSPGATRPLRASRSGARPRSRRDREARRRAPRRPAHPLDELLEPRARRDRLAPLEVDQLAREPVADRAPEVLLDQPARQVRQRLALVERTRDPRRRARRRAPRASCASARSAARRRSGPRPSGTRGAAGRSTRSACAR